MYEFLYLTDDDPDGGLALAEALTAPLGASGPPPVVLVSIAVTPANATHTLTASPTPIQYTATGTFSDASTQDLTAAVTWATGTPATATISNGAGTEGQLTPVAVGTTTVTATSGAIVGSTNATVQITLSSIAVTPANATHTLIASPVPIQYTATGTFSNGSTSNITTTVTWAIVNGAVGSISNGAGTEGQFTPAAVGTTSITATSGAIVGSTNVTVQIVLSSIDVTPNALTWRPTASSDRQSMVATGTFSNGSTQVITTTVTWTSGTPAVGTISNGAGTEGQVTPLTVGPTLITATSGAISGNETLTIDTAIDATSGKGVPTNAFQWGMAGLVIASEWQAQEASGNLAGTGPSSFTLTANATPLYQQGVTGWTRTASAFNQTSGQRFAAAAATGPSPASTSVLWIGYMVSDTLPAAVRGMLNVGGNIGVGLVNASGNIRLHVAGVTVDDSTTNPAADNLVHPIIVKHDRTNSVVVLYTDEAKTPGTFAAATDGIKGFGAGIFSTSIPALGGVLIGAVASGANAELSDAAIKTILQNLHWTIPWS